MNRKIVILALAVILVIIGILLPLPLPVSFSNKKAFNDPVHVQYSGEGMLYVCAAVGDIPVSGENTVKMKPPVKASTGRERTVLIYIPPGFEPDKVYPVMYLLHGFAARPVFWIKNLIPAIDQAIISGELPPLVVVMPDGTLSGNGRDDPSTKLDERGGCWYINSNRIRYEDFLLYELPAFVRTVVRITDDPEYTIIAGSSMGGFGAAYYSIKYPERFRNAGLFYAALDLRYAVGGKRLKAFRVDRYKPLTRDNPYRIVNKAAGAGILGLTDRWCFYPVFNSDSIPGEFWTKDLPVWQRMQEVNPADILRTTAPDLNETRFFILTGSDDDFNFDDHQAVAIPLIRQAGGSIAPAETIIPGGRHNWNTIEKTIPDFITWLGDTFQ